MRKALCAFLFLVGTLFPVLLVAESMIGEGPALGTNRITQDQIVSGALTRDEIRLAGRNIFITFFNKYDGYGDGPPAPAPHYQARRNVGQRITLHHNGAFLRINGLDAQACVECHLIVSNKIKPPICGTGGVGLVSNTVMGPGSSFVNAIDDPKLIKDPHGLGTTLVNNMNGRAINAPLIFGAAGPELLAKEMTFDLQELRSSIEFIPNASIGLITKGVSFGTLRTDGNVALIFDDVEGIDADLVVKPFGRKGEFPTTRAFDIGALQFHQGMQPVEVVGQNVDEDGDGVSNEILVGELSALSIFNACLPPPFQQLPHKGAKRREVLRGKMVFEEVGCATCHIPVLQTEREELTFAFPEVPHDPYANVYYSVNLTEKPMNFTENDQGGVSVNLFSDLKRHHMGAELAEFNDDDTFITARLWGVADTAPYLHDGRAFTLMQAIVTHGGAGSEAEPAVELFLLRNEDDQHSLIAFLNALRTPRNVDADLNRLAKDLNRL
jgi:hypothetical protein